MIYSSYPHSEKYSDIQEKKNHEFRSHQINQIKKIKKKRKKIKNFCLASHDCSKGKKKKKSIGLKKTSQNFNKVMMFLFRSSHFIRYD
jgi:hypothetical protein